MGAPVWEIRWLAEEQVWGSQPGQEMRLGPSFQVSSMSTTTPTSGTRVLGSNPILHLTFVWTSLSLSEKQGHRPGDVSTASPAPLSLSQERVWPTMQVSPLPHQQDEPRPNSLPWLWKEAEEAPEDCGKWVERKSLSSWLAPSEEDGFVCVYVCV